MRLHAEWEKQLCTIVSMPHKDSDWSAYLAESQDVVNELITQIVRFQHVIVLYKYAEDVAQWRNFENVFCVNIALNDTWCRDFMPLSLTHSRRILMLDFIFNGWGGKFASNLDNIAGEALFESKILQKLHSNIVFKRKNFILEGGSIDCNGNGVVLTTENCLLEPNRNKLSKTQITKKLRKYLHAKSILWLKNGELQGDDTDSHIDNLARFVDRHTIVYLHCEDKNHPNYVSLYKMKKELHKLKDVNGEKFRLVEIPMPTCLDSSDFMKDLDLKKAVESADSKKNKDSAESCARYLPASYVNFIFVNDGLIVPIFGDKNDEVALRIFKKLFPKREIIGIDARTLVRQGGSLHCMTMNVPRP